jgi:hypothetical protein
MRREQDYTDFRMSLRVLGASYEQFIGDEHVGYYWSVLEDEPFEVVEALCDRLTRSDHAADAKIPSAHQLRKMAVSERSGSQYELPCQQPGCRALMSWPPKSESESRFFCPRHEPDHGRPATTEERQALMVQATAEARAFLRTALQALMADIPVSDGERQADIAQSTLRRPVAFADKAEGPGVNPSVFLNRPFLSDGMPSDYADRRQMVAAAGWKFQPSKGYWTKSKRVLTDEQVDSFSDQGLLADFLKRR